MVVLIFSYKFTFTTLFSVSFLDNYNNKKFMSYVPYHPTILINHYQKINLTIVRNIVIVTLTFVEKYKRRKKVKNYKEWSNTRSYRSKNETQKKFPINILEKKKFWQPQKFLYFFFFPFHHRCSHSTSSSFLCFLVPFSTSHFLSFNILTAMHGKTNERSWNILYFLLFLSYLSSFLFI